MKRRIALASSLGFLLSCGTSRNGDQKSRRNMRTLQHPNGLSAVMEEGWTATETAGGYLLTPPDAQSVRYPTEIEVALQPGRNPEGPWPHARPVNGVEVLYRVTEDAGGAGAKEFTLQAWRPCGGVHILVRQSKYAETEQEADFSAGFAVLGSASCRERR